MHGGSGVFVTHGRCGRFDLFGRIGLYFRGIRGQCSVRILVGFSLLFGLCGLFGLWVLGGPILPDWASDLS